MMQFLFPALPLSLLWVAITGRVELGSLLVGYIIALLILFGLRQLGINIQGYFTPRQIIAILRYSVLLFWNGLVSSIYVAQMLLRPKIELKTGIVVLNTGDTTTTQHLTALSAHGLNMTPGELVIDFGDNGKLYVHCLDIDSSRSKLEGEQQKRIKLLHEILGMSDD